MLIIAPIGFVGHSYLGYCLAQTVYATTPIDEYCTVKVPATSDDGSLSIEHVIPCRETGGIIKTADIKPRSFEEDATDQVARTYLNQLAIFLDKQSSAPSAPYLDAAYLDGSAAELAKSLQPRILLALPDVNWTLDERISHDPTVLQLRAQIAQFQGRRPGAHFGAQPTVTYRNPASLTVANSLL